MKKIFPYIVILILAGISSHIVHLHVTYETSPIAIEMNFDSEMDKESSEEKDFREEDASSHFKYTELPSLSHDIYISQSTYTPPFLGLPVDPPDCRL